MATKTVTVADVRTATELLLEKLQTLWAAQETAIAQAAEVARLVDAGTPFPRLNAPVLDEAQDILHRLDGTLDSMVDSVDLIRDAETLLDLIDLAAAKGKDG